MPDLKNKIILIVSPQAWGKMFVSKHHYAVELAKRGNTVYYLNPPDKIKAERSERIAVNTSDVHPSLFFIEHRLNFPYNLKFRALPLFHWLMQFHIRQVLAKIGRPVDIVWSFDLGYLYPFKYFSKNSFKVFHPVDEPLSSAAIDASKGADIMFSVTQEILQKYADRNIPTHFINHGVTADFFKDNVAQRDDGPVRIGFSGNMLRTDIDREILLEIVKRNDQCIFEFWGSYSTEQANIGGSLDDATCRFIAELKSYSHVVLHGAISTKELATAIGKMDAFLICYDVERDQSKGTNYHKVMEYLSTGKVVVSNNITTYKDRSDLVQMVDERSTNSRLPDLFSKVISDLGTHNSETSQLNRIVFANDNSYTRQIDKIEQLILNKQNS